MANAYATQCERLLAMGKLSAKFLLAYLRTGRIEQDEYDDLTAKLEAANENE